MVGRGRGLWQNEGGQSGTMGACCRTREGPLAGRGGRSRTMGGACGRTRKGPTLGRGRDLWRDKGGT